MRCGVGEFHFAPGRALVMEVHSDDPLDADGMNADKICTINS
jgi:hypothetical protein